ncbi:hypothetical protein PAXRUDRAFT_252342 [Paxillus rubicundulus Ve08.2h10]|uniref:Unplaced genomic scaffold scaffold_13, whole genome shotgun sequence n=1 Tax=Paxillus rubicundulus Ve08.2h10 TaxID=930991 RepID=A0A0D0E656_9AGAM|nr:hypothetical protein PAXRUDRAFT_252342 [Paxillus rubicundulus Ve08.2h10]
MFILSFYVDCPCVNTPRKLSRNRGAQSRLVFVFSSHSCTKFSQGSGRTDIHAIDPWHCLAFPQYLLPVGFCHKMPIVANQYLSLEILDNYLLFTPPPAFGVQFQV